MIPQIIRYFRFEPFTDGSGNTYMAPPNFKFGDDYYTGYDLEPFAIKYNIHKDNDLQPDTFTITLDNYFFQNPTNNTKYVSGVSNRLTDPLESFNPSVNHVIAIGPFPEDASSWEPDPFYHDTYCYEDHMENLMDGPVFGFVKSWNQVGADKIEITCTSFMKILADYQSSSTFVINNLDDDVNSLQIYYESQPEGANSAAYFAAKDTSSTTRELRNRISPAEEPIDENEKTPAYPRFEFFIGTIVEGYFPSKIAWRLLQEIGWCREDYQTSAYDLGATVKSGGNPAQVTTVQFINPFQRFSCASDDFNSMIMGTDIDSSYTQFQFKAFDTDGLRYEYPAESTGTSGTELVYDEQYFLSFDPSKQSLLYNLKNISDAAGLYITVTCCPRFVKRSGYETTQFVWDFRPYEIIENLRNWGVAVGFHPKIMMKRNMAQVFDFEYMTSSEIIYPVYDTNTFDINVGYRMSLNSTAETWSGARDAEEGILFTMANFVAVSQASGGGSPFGIYRIPITFNTVQLPSNATVTGAQLLIPYNNWGTTYKDIYVVGDSENTRPLATVSKADYNKSLYGNYATENVYGHATHGASGTLTITLNSYGLLNIKPNSTARFMLIHQGDYTNTAPGVGINEGIYTTSSVILRVTYIIEGQLNNYLQQLNILNGPALSYGAFNNPPDSDYKNQVLVKGIKWDKDQSDVINKVLVKYGQGQDYSKNYIELPPPQPIEYFFIVDFKGSVLDTNSIVTFSVYFINDSVDSDGLVDVRTITRQYPTGATSFDVANDIINSFPVNDYYQLQYTNDVIIVVPLDDNNKLYWKEKNLYSGYTWPNGGLDPDNPTPVVVSISSSNILVNDDKNAVPLGYSKEFMEGEPIGFQQARESQQLNGIRTARLSFPEVSNLGDVMRISDMIFRKLGREKYRCSVECANADTWQLPLFGLYNILDNTHTKRIINAYGAKIIFYISGSPDKNGYMILSIPSPFSSTLVGLPVQIDSTFSAVDILNEIKSVFDSTAGMGASVTAEVDVSEQSLTFTYDTDVANNVEFKYNQMFDYASLSTTVNGLTLNRIVMPPSQFAETTFNEYLHLLSYDSNSTKSTYSCVFGVPNEELSNIVSQALAWIADVEKAQ
jgi:hypothetical protein